MKTTQTYLAVSGDALVSKSAEEISEIPLQRINDHQFYLLHKNRNFSFQLLSINLELNLVELKFNNRILQIQITGPVQQLIQTLGYHSNKAKHSDALLAPMPGVVLDILTSCGSQIEKGDPLIVLEAMKMENILRASHSGVIKEIFVVKGDKVEKNKILISFT